MRLALEEMVEVGLSSPQKDFDRVVLDPQLVERLSADGDDAQQVPGEGEDSKQPEDRS